MTDYAADIKRYTKTVDTKAVAAIVRHLGIALKSKDAANVSCSSKAERDRVRDGWLKKKLALATSDAELDKAVKAVCQRMKADSTKSRVTFYYLAERFGKLDAPEPAVPSNPRKIDW